MKRIVLIAALVAAGPSFGKSLDGARALAARIESRLPGLGNTLLCPSCDEQWAEGGEAVNTLERVLARVSEDPRLAATEDGEALGALISEHIVRASAEAHPGDASDGPKSLCGLSRPPCELFTPTLFKDYCDTVDRLR